MKKILFFALLLSSFALAQGTPKTPPTSSSQPDVSGMYAFLKEGEFVEVDVDDDRVTGFISRFGESESDKGAVLDHMFTKGTFDGTNLAFTTRELHGVSYEFKGKIVRGEGKQPGSEGYYVIKGTLTETTLDANKKASARQREVELKSFPSDVQPKPSKKELIHLRVDRIREDESTRHFGGS
jgi:hypothetical protein